MQTALTERKQQLQGSVDYLKSRTIEQVESLTAIKLEGLPFTNYDTLVKCVEDKTKETKALKPKN